MPRLIAILVVVIVALPVAGFLFVMETGIIFPFQLAFDLSVGWAIFFSRVIPEIRASSSNVVMSIVSIIALAFGTHLFLRRFHGQVFRSEQADEGANRYWMMRWTVGILMLIALMFIAGLSAAGLHSQLVWQIATREQMLKHQGSVAPIYDRTSEKNLERLAAAINGFQSKNGSFPAAAIYDREQRPLLSWRVAILSFVDEQPLYEKFHLDESWDSPHNLRLLPLMPSVYQSSYSESKTPHARFRVFTGKGTSFEGAKGLRFPADFPSGSHKTILIAEAAQAVPWTKPEELLYDPDKPLPTVGDRFPTDFLAVMIDGWVVQFKEETNEQEVRCWIVRNGTYKPKQ